MLRLTALCAAAGIAFTALAVTSPAQAAFSLIKWDGTGVCQIWDNSIPGKPIPSTYKALGKPVATFGDALTMKSGLLAKGTCKL